uniref:G protein gamma domain-containing protein n=1 Tax=Anthurium amnicola TaxID=1678845 RepID=A0A1D1Z2T8_9ARAE
MASSSSAGDGAPPMPPQPPPSPGSPLTYPDSCGRHRLQVGVQILNREIGFLQEELQSLGDLQPASNCCKGVNEFVGTNPDPLLPMHRRRRKCHFWRSLGAKLCIGLSWIGCCGCSFKQPKNCCCRCSRMPNDRSCCRCGASKQCKCCSCVPSKICSCDSCIRPKCWNCCKSGSCMFPSCSCPEYHCGCVWSCSNCAGARLCPRCCRPCCISRCLCP